METITIQECPLCKMCHIYDLEVERSYFIKMMTMNSHSAPRNTVRYTRLFSCPIKDDNFQANIVLTESSDDRIKSVSVKGIKNEKKTR